MGTSGGASLGRSNVRLIIYVLDINLPLREDDNLPSQLLFLERLVQACRLISDLLALSSFSDDSIVHRAL